MAAILLFNNAIVIRDIDDGKETSEEIIAAEEIAAEEFAKAAEEIAYGNASGVTNGRGVGTSC